MKPFSFLAAALFILLTVLPPSRAETTDEQSGSIKLDVNVVNILCTVRDKQGRLVSNLDKNDFEIREDGKPQVVSYFARETTQPLTLGLLVDSSVSQANVIDQEQRAASVFFERMLKPKDAAFLISFDEGVDLLQDITDSPKLLKTALTRVKVRQASPPPSSMPTHTPGGIGIGGVGGVMGIPTPFPTSRPQPTIQLGGTHLYDAVYLAANEVLHSEAGRKALILITDGQDSGSMMKKAASIEAAQRNDVIIYTILYWDRSFYGGGAGYSGDDVVREMASETGGRVFNAENDRELALAFQQISDELRSQYSLGYSPTNAKKDGSYRRVDVRIRRGGMKVQARKGYYAPAEEARKN